MLILRSFANAPQKLPSETLLLPKRTASVLQAEKLMLTWRLKIQCPSSHALISRKLSTLPAAL